MSYRPGDTIYLSFTTQSAAGAANDADTTPTASMRRNGAIDSAVTIAMTHNGTGDYTASATLPLTYVAGDDLEILVSATVGGTAGKGVLPLGKLDRDAQDFARELLGASGAVWHVATSGSDTSDGRSWTTAFATPSHAISVATAGDAILMGPGTFSLGFARLILPSGVFLAGAGLDRTVITSTLINGPIVTVAANCTVQDLTVQGVATPGVAVFQIPIGDGADAPGVVLRRVRTISDTDGLYFQYAGSLARCYDSYLSSGWDCVFATNGATVELFCTLLKTTGPNSASPNSNGTAQAISGAVIRMWDCVIASNSTNSNPSRSTYGIRTDTSGGSPGTAELYRCVVALNVVDGTIYDLRMDGGTVIKVSQTPYRSDRVLGGPPIVLDVPGPFQGANSVTLNFKDSAGNPVPDVVFAVQGVGSAVSDGSGVKTIGLPAGTFTISALPSAGVMFSNTTITLATSATFTINGAATTISPAGAPAQTTGYLTTRDGQGNALPSVTLTFQLIDPQRTTDSYDQTSFTATSDSGALLQVPLLQSTQYQARVGSGPWVPFTTGTNSTFALPEVLGAYSA